MTYHIAVTIVRSSFGGLPPLRQSPGTAFAPAYLNLSSRAHSGSGNSIRLVNIIRFPLTHLSFCQFHEV